mgnify:CR=1 FL=1|tara:strand:- start:1650 stop:2009 length:360 start_codon:yes stop_codon:yes gene_type:complete
MNNKTLIILILLYFLLNSKQAEDFVFGLSWDGITDTVQNLSESLSVNNIINKCMGCKNNECDFKQIGLDTISDEDKLKKIIEKALETKKCRKCATKLLGNDGSKVIDYKEIISGCNPFR